MHQQFISSNHVQLSLTILINNKRFQVYEYTLTDDGYHLQINKNNNAKKKQNHPIKFNDQKYKCKVPERSAIKKKQQLKEKKNNNK